MVRLCCVLFLLLLFCFGCSGVFIGVALRNNGETVVAVVVVVGVGGDVFVNLMLSSDRLLLLPPLSYYIRSFTGIPCSVSSQNIHFASSDFK